MNRRYSQIADDELIKAHSQHGPIDSFLRQGSPGPSVVGWMTTLAFREGLQKEKHLDGHFAGM